MNTKKKKSNMNKKRVPAFTVIEVLIVLSLVSFFVGISILTFKRAEENMRVQLFLNNFERSVAKLQHIAITRQLPTWISKNKGKINASSIGDGSSLYSVPSFDIPPELSSNREDGPIINFRAISANIETIQQITFTWKDRKVAYDYQFQMGSGRYTKKII